MSPNAPRSTRDRPAKTPLSHDAVIATGLAIARAEGLEAVTMRRVAAALDTGPASLYVYVANREALLRAMFDEVAGLVPVGPVDPARWRAQVHELLGGWLTAMAAHPGIAAIALGEPPMTPQALRATEFLMQLLLAGGISPPDAALACDILALVTTAAAVEDPVHRARPGSQRQAEAGLAATFAALPPAEFPALSRYSAELAAGEGDERFRFAVDVILDGLLARAHPPAPGQESSPPAPKGTHDG